MVTTRSNGPATTETEELPALPFHQPDILHMPPRARELQAACPIAQVRTPAGDEAWLVTRYAEARRLYNDDRLGIAHRDPAQAPRLSASILLGGPGGNFETEHADRARMRSHLAPFFTAGRMRTFSSKVEMLTEEALRDIKAMGPPADLHEELCVRLPVTVICELLGVPSEDRVRFRAWTQGIADVANRENSQHALRQLMGYTHQLVRRKRTDPADDVISGLCAAENGTFTDDYISFLAAMLLFAGHETTVVRIDYGILLMLVHPGLRQVLTEQPEKLDAAIEEILRIAVHGGARETIRYARQDVAIGGVTIRAGDLILLYSAAANRDERVFGNPDRFDITRSCVPHLTFGYGSHYCLGAPLVRIELRALLSRILREFPGIQMHVPVEQLRTRREVLTGGLVALPVTW